MRVGSLMSGLLLGAVFAASSISIFASSSSGPIQITPSSGGFPEQQAQTLERAVQRPSNPTAVNTVGSSSKRVPLGQIAVKKPSEIALQLRAKVVGPSNLLTVAFGCNGEIRTFSPVPGSPTRLYIGGRFSACGEVAANNIVLFVPPSTFIPLVSGGVNGTNGPVNALAVHDGALIVGGEFSETGPDSNVRLARWDGFSWQSLGSVAGAGRVSVNAISSAGADLYIGGAFEQVGSVPARNIARLRAGVWAALAQGISGYFGAGAANATPSLDNDAVRAIVAAGPEVFVGGYFRTAGTTPVSSIAAWNGSAWRDVSQGTRNEPNNPFPGQVISLSASPTDLYVGGRFINIGEAVGANNVARYNLAQRQFSTMGTGITAAAFLNSFNLSVSAVHHVAGRIYAAGKFSTAGGVSAERAAVFANGSWSALTSGMGESTEEYSEARAVFATSADAVYFGGLFVDAGDLPLTNFASWNGSTFQQLGFSGGNGLNGVVFTLLNSGTNIYAGGVFSSAGSVAARNVARWDGTRWNAMGTPSSNGTDSVVYALAEYQGRIYAGGSFDRAAGLTARKIAAWNPSNGLWESVSTGASSTVRALASFDNVLYAGGFFDSIAGITALRVARFNGQQWLSLGDGGANGVAGQGFAAVLSLKPSATTLLVGGLFTRAGPLQNAGNIAAWTGSQWSPLGSGLPGVVFDTATFQGSIYAASDRSLARFNGSSWEPSFAPTGAVTPVFYALSAVDDRLFIGGDFSAVSVNGQVLPSRNLFSISSANLFSANEQNSLVASNTIFDLIGVGSTLLSSGAGLREVERPTPVGIVAGQLGNAGSQRISLSRDGSASAFVSASSNLVAGDVNPNADVFLKLPTGALSRVSDVARTSIGVTEAYAQSVISPDGLSVAFVGASSNQVFDVRNGVARIVSRSTAGANANGLSSRPYYLQNADVLLFDSVATNLAPDSNGATSDVFMRNLLSNETELVSKSASGQAGNCGSTSGVASSDGSVRAFVSCATNLDVPGSLTAPNVTQIIADLPFSKAKLMVSRNRMTGAAGNGNSARVQLSQDGRYGVFESAASNLLPGISPDNGDTNGAVDVFWFELDGVKVRQLIRVSTSSTGNQANGDSRNASLSGDGQLVTYQTDASNLIPNDTNGTTDIVVKRVSTGELVLQSLGLNGAAGNGASQVPALSADGSAVGYTTSATNLVPGDANGSTDTVAVNIGRSRELGFVAAQRGLTGTWFNPATLGQGMVFEILPKADGSADLFGAWFTYDSNPAGAASSQRWIAFSGALAAGQNTASLAFSSLSGGNLAAAPAPTQSIIGAGSVQFLSCSRARITFQFTSGNLGSSVVDLNRFGEPFGCFEFGLGSPLPSDFGHSGSYFDLNLSGQGVSLEINPKLQLAFGGWYTFARGGLNAAGDADRLRWFSLEPLSPSTYRANDRTIAMQIRAVSGGIFNSGAPQPQSAVVGTATVVFEPNGATLSERCRRVRMNYVFTGGENAGLSGTLVLQKSLPTLSDCNGQ